MPNIRIEALSTSNLSDRYTVLEVTVEESVVDLTVLMYQQSKFLYDGVFYATFTETYYPPGYVLKNKINNPTEVYLNANNVFYIEFFGYMNQSLITKLLNPFYVDIGRTVLTEKASQFTYGTTVTIDDLTNLWRNEISKLYNILTGNQTNVSSLDKFYCEGYSYEETSQVLTEPIILDNKTIIYLHCVYNERRLKVGAGVNGALVDITSIQIPNIDSKLKTTREITKVFVDDKLVWKK